MVSRNGKKKTINDDNAATDSTTATAMETSRMSGIAPVSLSDVELATLTDFESIVSTMGAPKSASELIGTGFAVIDDKAKLIDVEMMIVRHSEHDGDNGRFATLHVITRDGDKLIINDGSTGIMKQCSELDRVQGENAWLPLYVAKGLRVSEYDHVRDDGSITRAATYYINNSR